MTKLAARKNQTKQEVGQLEQTTTGLATGAAAEQMLAGAEALDLAHGMARLAGELEAVRNVVHQLVMPVLSAFLSNHSAHLQEIAADTIVRSAGSHALSQVIAAKGTEIGEMGAQKVAEGLTRPAASEAMAERSEELAAAGVVLGIQGVAQVDTAFEEADLAKKIQAASVAGIAEGAAMLGTVDSKDQPKQPRQHRPGPQSRRISGRFKLMLYLHFMCWPDLTVRKCNFRMLL